MTPSANFIANGDIQPGYVQPVDRLHVALRFRFRPVLSAQRAASAVSRAALRELHPCKFPNASAKLDGMPHERDQHIR